MPELLLVEPDGRLGEGPVLHRVERASPREDRGGHRAVVLTHRGELARMVVVDHRANRPGAELIQRVTRLAPCSKNPD